MKTLIIITPRRTLVKIEAATKDWGSTIAFDDQKASINELCHDGLVAYELMDRMKKILALTAPHGTISASTLNKVQNIARGE